MKEFDIVKTFMNS
jgi:hypothetical protein